MQYDTYKQPPGEFLDLMAYARGAEFANQANWNDVKNDISTRTSEDQLRRSQVEFDLKLPYAQLESEDRAGTAYAARSMADWQANLTNKMASMPREQQPQAYADAIGAQLRGIVPNSPGAAKQQEALRMFATRKAVELAESDNIAGAQAILAQLPGADTSRQMGEIMKWRNPAALTPENIQTAGGTVGPDGQITYAGVRMSPFEFAERMQAQAVNAMVNPMAGLQKVFERNQQVDFAGQVASLNNAQNNGVQFMVNPQTGQIMGIRMNPDGTVTSVPVNTAVGGGQPTPAPAVAGGNIPLPSGVAPSTAGAGRGTMDWRTDPRVVDPQAGAVPSSMAQPVVTTPPAPPMMLDGRTVNPAWQAWNAQYGQQPGQGQTLYDLLYASGTPGQVNTQYANTAAQWRGNPRVTQPAVDATWWASLTPQQQQQLLRGTIPMPAAPSNAVPGAPGNWLTNIPR